MKPSVRLGMLALIVAACSLLGSRASAAEPCPGAVMGLRTVQCVQAEKPDQPIHIVYIHGIRASGPDFSRDFREAVCKHMAEGCPEVKPTRHYLDLGSRPSASFLGDVVWTEDDWKAGQPFVERYVYRTSNKAPIIIDEINYWPLLLAFKCQYLVPPDATLTGPDKEDIEICAGHPKPGPREKRARKPAEPIEDPYLHAWIDDATRRELLATRPPLGGGAWINKLLKTSILNWGISDAVISLGPMKKYTRLAIWCAFEEIEVFDPEAPPPKEPSIPHSCKAEDNALKATDQQFVVISESLGSFVLLDAFASATYLSERKAADLAEHKTAAHPATEPVAPAVEGTALQFIVKRSDNIYFFANQFALLELARVEGVYVSDSRSANPDELVGSTMRTWAMAGSASGNAKQLVAFNDPSDILTYTVPDFCKAQSTTKACDAVIRNIPVKNSFNWFGLFERPDYAHTYYSRNPKVLSVIFGTQAPARRPR